MLNSLYVKDYNDKVYTKVVAVLLVNSIPTYIDAYGEGYEVGVAHVIDIDHIVDPYLGIEWHDNGLTFKTYERKYPREL
ncbi:TPA: hypothetical protein MA058_003408 [Klebsiella pneumoniae]|nr:hypothetical protein [Klebsiella pneumoniae]